MTRGRLRDIMNAAGELGAQWFADADSVDDYAIGVRFRAYRQVLEAVHNACAVVDDTSALSEVIHRAPRDDSNPAACLDWIAWSSGCVLGLTARW